MTMVTVKHAQSKSELQAVFDIRREVFVKEQNVEEAEEYDEFEESSTHLIAYYQKTPVGTCRFRNTDKGIKLERFAVLRKHRNAQVGSALIQAVLEQLDVSQYIYLHAQIQVVEFYQRFGFIAEGEKFEEANIQHYKMYYQP